MNEVVLMAVEHAFDDLFKKSAASILVESAPLDDVVEKFTPLKKLHDDGDLHVL
jgi:hypothetical protein